MQQLYNFIPLFIKVAVQSACIKYDYSAVSQDNCCR